jgi:hypothetical protein
MDSMGFGVGSDIFGISCCFIDLGSKNSTINHGIYEFYGYFRSDSIRKFVGTSVGGARSALSINGFGNSILEKSETF